MPLIIIKLPHYLFCEYMYLNVVRQCMKYMQLMCFDIFVHILTVPNPGKHYNAGLLKCQGYNTCNDLRKKLPYKTLVSKNATSSTYLYMTRIHIRNLGSLCTAKRAYELMIVIVLICHFQFMLFYFVQQL